MRSCMITTILAAAILLAQAERADADGAGLSELALDVVPVEVVLHVNHLVEFRHLVGDPPVVGRASTEVSFTKRGIYTLLRLRPGLGIDFMAIPGFLDDPRFPEISRLSVYQTHTCVNDETMPIGRESRDLSGSAQVHPASGAIMLTSEEGPGNQVRVAVGSWDVETDFVDCPREDCFIYNFHFSGPVCEDPDAWVETEEGHEEYRGFELATIDWNLIRALALGGEIPLAIPISASHTEEIAGDGETTTIVFTVTGAIAMVDQLPIEALEPPAEAEE